MGIDIKSERSGAAVHFRLVICVSLRTAASVEAPSSLIVFSARLRARGRMGTVRE